MVNLLVAAAIASATPQPATPVADANPAMFVVRDRDTTVYIFGTFHALDGRANWFNDKVKNAFEQSGELVLETLVPEMPVKMPRVPVVPGSLSVTPSASFLATTRMAINAGRSQGMNVAAGADMVLRDAAEVEGKRIEGLETLESQLAMFQRMAAPAAPARTPGAAVQPSPMQGLSKTMTDMQAAWKRGEQTIFVRMLGQLEKGSPSTYRLMFTERNARWADWVAARLQAPGTVFVAVGAGHLAGKDSLLVRLAEKGIESSRVN